ncbi:GNAT family N-acetyltransferase [Ktedonobacter racemifer]|uniref:GCN5-related N-acetyltransferase n=1 Tax=Ktedonobacter racemifer DSM 44963 TaxID=485913 RepID=D6U437_KTERA|nr:GNAT family N-acetyltransferase [Ktedonobacter racemifer]EFH81275.1 GCN5-related N-acetyltransferase [Ktedonobacter racemifer DSM 44963]
MTQLVSMTEEQFEQYLSHSIREYAEDHIKGGRWTAENAYEESRKEFQNYLPEGVQTPDHYLYSIYDEQRDAHVGILWFARVTWSAEPMAFVYDVKIDEAHRRHGYGSQAFQLMEEKVRELGLSSIGLHVFGHNKGALQMYEKLGYVPTNINMRKILG